MSRFASAAILATCFLAGAPAFAQDAEDLQGRMNRSDLCAPVGLDGKTILRIFDFSGVGEMLLSSVNTRVAFDNNAHEVTRFTAGEDGIELEARLACRPRAQGVIARVLSVTGRDVSSLEVGDTMICTGQPGDVDCAITGLIGNLVGERSGIDTKMTALVTESLNATASLEAAAAEARAVNAEGEVVREP